MDEANETDLFERPPEDDNDSSSKDDSDDESGAKNKDGAAWDEPEERWVAGSKDEEMMNQPH